MLMSVSDLAGPISPSSGEKSFRDLFDGNQSGQLWWPLIFENKVVGVNTLKIVEEGFEGLNFAIHYQEVLKFLRKHGIE